MAKIIFSEKFIEENEREFKRVEEEIDNAKEALRLARSKRRCRICGGTYFRAGYCLTCYLSIQNGKSPSKKTLVGKAAKEGRNVRVLYERVTGKSAENLTDEYIEQWAQGLFNLADEDLSEYARLYFVNKKTQKEIGEHFGVHYKIVSRRINEFIKQAKSICGGE